VRVCSFILFDLMNALMSLWYIGVSGSNE